MTADNAHSVKLPTRAEFESELEECLQEWYYDGPGAVRDGNGAKWDALAMVDEFNLRFPGLLNFSTDQDELDRRLLACTDAEEVHRIVAEGVAPEAEAGQL
jgi:hypothetical protein